MAAPNPFAAPGSDLTPPDPHPPGAPWKAILVGFVVDVAFTIIFSFAWSIVFGAYLAASGNSPEEIRAMAESSQAGDFYSGVLIAIGGVGSLIGGYLCARIARRNEYRIAAVLTAISLVLGWIVSGNDEGGMNVVTSTLLTIAATYAGVMLGVRRNQARP